MCPPSVCLCVYVHISVHTECVWLSPEQYLRFPGSGVIVTVSLSVHVLGMECRPFRRATSSCKYQAISLAPIQVYYLLTSKYLNFSSLLRPLPYPHSSAYKSNCHRIALCPVTHAHVC